jgi:hypothetical protein
LLDFVVLGVKNEIAPKEILKTNGGTDEKPNENLNQNNTYRTSSPT